MNDEDDGVHKERFLEFMKNQGRTGEDLAKAVFTFHQNHDLDIRNLQGQSYDNASSMSGMYSGLQPRIK